MDFSLAALEQAVSIRRQISALEKQLSGLFSGRTGGSKPSGGAGVGGRRRLSPAARAKIAAAARARWARVRAGRGAVKGKAKPSGKKGGLSAAGRKKLSDMMKARWAARRKAQGKKR
jgi:hypothetical protein